MIGKWIPILGVVLSMTQVIADLERCMGQRTDAARSLAEQSSIDEQEMQEALTHSAARW